MGIFMGELLVSGRVHVIFILYAYVLYAIQQQTQYRNRVTLPQVARMVHPKIDDIQDGNLLFRQVNHVKHWEGNYYTFNANTMKLTRI